MIIVTSRDATVTVDATKLSAEIVEKLLEYGIRQKIGDAASGARKIAEETGTDITEVTQGLMDKALAALLAGEWSSRVAGEGVSERRRVERAIMRAAVKVKLGAKSPKWKAFIGQSDDAQNAKLDEMFAANAVKLAAKVDEEIARREAAKKAKAKLSDGIEIDL